ncbi:PH domain-containing protein [Gracilimonas mengyeensis]|uniref:PH domain-containing protein n=1 Tax=Gracilimonas mengyeensis TaxID=1302730 RepID=A0A521D729_9BACT|nr:PH domain-containing protein [Gracilimonas mengyeensis]SMO66710.1 PH domain-containing protein [Gracilimonas mengyeensis]
MKKQFRAPWDLLLTSLTVIVIAVLIGINYATPGLITTLITWGIILGTAAFGVYGYSVQNEKLKILRLGWSKDLSFSSIKKIEYTPNAMLGSIRTFGVGGLFCYLGYFKNSVLGSYKAYATHRKRTVVVTTQDDDQIVLSPEKPKDFVETIKERMEQIEQEQ